MAECQDVVDLFSTIWDNLSGAGAIQVGVTKSIHHHRIPISRRVLSPSVESLRHRPTAGAVECVLYKGCVSETADRPVAIVGSFAVTYISYVCDSNT